MTRRCPMRHGRLALPSTSSPLHGQRILPSSAMTMKVISCRRRFMRCRYHMAKIKTVPRPNILPTRATCGCCPVAESSANTPVEDGMSQTSSGAQSATNDPVSNVLKWILLAVAVVTFALLAWATVRHLRAGAAAARPLRRPRTARLLMTADDIVAGKAGFQKADLMDYGSLYGMGSYYGQDYTAWTLIRLAGLTEAAHRPGAVRQTVRPASARSAGRGARRDARAVAADRSDAADGHACPTRWPPPSSRCATTSRRNWRRPISIPAGRRPTA